MSVLDRFARQLSRIHPVFYLTAYLAVIPAFGFLYTYASPHGFYAPYSRYEPAAARDIEHLSRIIESEVKRLSHYTEDMEITVDGDRVFLNAMRIDYLNSTDGSSIVFRLSFPLASDRRATRDNIRTIVPGLYKYIEINAVPMLELKDSAGEYTLREFRFIQTINDYRFAHNSFTDKVFNNLIVDDGAGCQLFTTCPLFITHREDERVVKNYLNGVKGDPFAISGRLSRMFYLSAVIVTTLGLGDIVPISGLSRLLVATEAVTGIMFAGLFLNSLAYRAANPEPKESSPRAETPEQNL